MRIQMGLPFNVLVVITSFTSLAVREVGTTNSSSPTAIFMASFYQGKDENCMVLVDPASTFSMSIGSWLPGSVPMIIANPDQEVINIRSLKRMTTCLLTIIDGSTKKNLPKVVLATNTIENHLLMVVNGSVPENSTLQKLKKPLLLINSTKDSTTFHLFCPKMGVPSLPSPKYATFCDHQGCMGSSTMADILAICSDPFRGQIISFAQAPAATMLYVARGRNGKTKMTGFLGELFSHLAKAFHFRPKFILHLGDGQYIQGNKSFTPGKLREIASGRVDVGLAGIAYLFAPSFDLGVPIIQGLTKYFTRTPRPTSLFGNIVRPFSIDIWVMFALSLFLIASVLLLCNYIYNLPQLWEYDLGKKDTPILNFYLFTYAKLSEPELGPWFKKWSTGRLVILLWSVQALFMILFYTSNLRAHMVSVDYEDPPRNLEAVAATGSKVYIYNSAIMARKEYLEASGQSGSGKHQVAVLAEKTGGIYDPAKHRGIHRDAPKDVIENGAFVYAVDYAIPHIHKQHSLLKRENIYIVEEMVNSYYACLITIKHSMGSKHIDRVTRRAVEEGLTNFWMTQHLSSRALLKPQPPMAAEIKPLFLSSLQTGFLLYFAGITISFMVLACSVLIHLYDRLNHTVTKRMI